MNVAIASAAGEDLPVVLDLLRRCNLPQAGLEQHPATTLVAREGVPIAGCAALELYGRAAPPPSVPRAPEPRLAGLLGAAPVLPPPLARDTEVLPVLGAGRGLQDGLTPIERLHLDARAEQRLSEVDGRDADDVQPVTMKEPIRLDP